jgi:DnaJ-class molecular chaperone
MAKKDVIYHLCEHCGGTGKLISFTNTEIDCPKCDGTGLVRWGEIIQEGT